MDSGWIAAAVVIGIAVVVGAVMLLVVLVAEPPVRTVAYAGEEVRFAYPDAWTLTEGEASGPRRVLAHLTSFSTGPNERCMVFAERCRWEGEALPAGGASVQVIAWEDGRPPEPNPSESELIGGKPSARAQATIADEFLSAWWQLSPPGFPDRWIEIRAEIRGEDLERGRRMAQIDQLLESLAFVDGP
jgi:hypothetical protein